MGLELDLPADILAWYVSCPFGDKDSFNQAGQLRDEKGSKTFHSGRMTDLLTPASTTTTKLLVPKPESTEQPRKADPEACATGDEPHDVGAV
jgi:hypothetical protein